MKLESPAEIWIAHKLVSYAESLRSDLRISDENSIAAAKFKQYFQKLIRDAEKVNKASAT